MSLKDISQTGNLPFTLPLVIGQYYMITSNVDKEDGILNGSIGISKTVSTKSKNQATVPELLWLALDDVSVAQNAKQKFWKTHQKYCKEHWTPIEKVVRDFPLGLSMRGGNRFRVE